jgi:hypothetical protein
MQSPTKKQKMDDGAPSLSVYESQRQANIKRNNDMLCSLGIQKLVDNNKAQRQTPRAPKKEASSSDTPKRKSLRNKGLNPDGSTAPPKDEQVTAETNKVGPPNILSLSVQ